MDDRKVNIMLVDDQAENLLALEALLAVLGQNLVKAASGKEALAHVLTDEFAVILLDVKMPDMDGFETAALIRQRDKTSHVPIIFMSASSAVEAQIFRGYQMGAVDYILKPVNPEILLSKVAVFVELEKRAVTIREQERLFREIAARRHAKQMEDAMAFSHAVSHDLRAPLRHIESFSQLLSETYGDVLGKEGREYLRKLVTAAQRMVRLIDAMNKLSEATRGDIQREIVDLSEFARDMSFQLRREDPQRRVDFSIQDGITATGDPNLLRLALQNLLVNAWKYTRKRSAARIEFGATRQGNGTVFFVKDDGVGFDMIHRDKLFVPFSRLHSRGEFEGSGIGLATVSRIISRHGGRIWGEGAVEGGATFYFTLPSEAGKA